MQHYLSVQLWGNEVSGVWDDGWCWAAHSVLPWPGCQDVCSSPATGWREHLPSRVLSPYWWSPGLLACCRPDRPPVNPAVAGSGGRAIHWRRASGLILAGRNGTTPSSAAVGAPRGSRLSRGWGLGGDSHHPGDVAPRGHALQADGPAVHVVVAATHLASQAALSDHVGTLAPEHLLGGEADGGAGEGAQLTVAAVHLP